MPRLMRISDPIGVFPLCDWFREPCARTEQHGSIITQQFNVTLTTVIFGRIHEGSDSGRGCPTSSGGRDIDR
jgi:hypothetical protein